jgi:predicted metal-dependent phosphoesterase TrpH
VLLDLHNHTRYSPDSKVDPAELVRLAGKLGLHGVAITDHNSVDGVRVAMEAARDLKGFVVIPATEISTSEGHVLAYGVTTAIPRDLSPPETVERVGAAGGIAVAAHPYRFWSGLGEKATLSAKFAAYEVHNARTLRAGNQRASKLAARTSVGRTGGSDTHFLRELGRGVTALNSGPASVDDILQAIASGKTSGTGLDRGPGETVVYVTKCVSEWVLRGMHRI